MNISAVRRQIVKEILRVCFLSTWLLICNFFFFFKYKNAGVQFRWPPYKCVCVYVWKCECYSRGQNDHAMPLSEPCNWLSESVRNQNGHARSNARAVIFSITSVDITMKSISCFPKLKNLTTKRSLTIRRFNPNKQYKVCTGTHKHKLDYIET